jgi:hypothetical protein
MATVQPSALTPAEAERLTILIEECGEVIQACSKVLRHGWDSTYDNGITNRQQLEIELGDVAWIQDLMGRRNDLRQIRVDGYKQRKQVRMLTSPYLHHQELRS